MAKKTYPSGVITPELGSTNWYSDYDTNSSLLDSNITKTNSLDSKVKELETNYTNVETSLTSLSAVAKSGDYNDLSNKPESIALAEKAVADGDNNVITNTYATKKEVVTSLEPYAKKTELADVATSGSYTDLSDKPTTIAHADRATADNNGDVITVTYAKKTEIPNLDGYALSKDISKVGKTNNYKDLDNLPTIPSLDGYVTNVELSPVAKSGDYNDLSNTPEPVDLTPYATKSELNAKANDADVVHKSGTETIVGTKTFSSQIKGSISGTSSNVVVGSDTATTRGYLVDGKLPWYTWEEGSQVIAGSVPLITDFNNLTKPGVYHVIFCLNDGFVLQENEYKESLNRPSIPGSTTGFMDAILEIKQTGSMSTISSASRLIQKLTLLSGSSKKIHTDLTYHRVCIMYSPISEWTAWKRVARDDEVVHKSGTETIVGTKTFSGEVQTNFIRAVGGGGANISLTPPDNGGFAIRAYNGTVNKELVGYPSGMLAWDNNEILTRVNGVTLDTAQTITGRKTFTEEVLIQSQNTPRVPTSSNQFGNGIQFRDSTGKRVAFINNFFYNDGSMDMQFHGSSTTSAYPTSYNSKLLLSLRWSNNDTISGFLGGRTIITELNQIMLAKNLTGANITPGGVVDCGNGNGKLKVWILNADGTFLLSDTLPTGIWKSTSFVTLAPNEGGIFIKLS